jgi:serine/threonine protein kinase
MELLSEYGVTVMSNREFDGRFARKSVIGSGTFGRVWKAFDEDVKQEVAIKKIDNFSSEHLGVSMLVIREVSFLRQLDHPNITKVREIILNRRCWQNSNALKLVMVSLQTTVSLYTKHVQLMYVISYEGSRKYGLGKVHQYPAGQAFTNDHRTYCKTGP